MCDLGAKLGHYLTVDFDKALLDIFVGLTARAYTGVAHVFVETYLLVRIGQRHFVFDAFGTRSEALAASGEAGVVAVVVVGALTRTALMISVGPLLTGLISSALALVVVVGSLLTGLVSSALALIVVVGSLLTGLVSAAFSLIIVVGPLLTGLVSAAVAVVVVVRPLLARLV